MDKNNHSIVIATHVYADGPSQAFREYLIKKNADFLWIGHPLFYNEKLKSSGYEVFVKGEKVDEYYKKIKKIPSIFSYFKDIFLTVYFVIKFRKKLNMKLFVGYNNLNAFAGILLKKMGIIQKVIYYVIDYTPRRFNNKYLNKIYHSLDHFCVKYADETWNLNEKAMNAARKKFWNFDAYKHSVQKTVPMGFWADRVSLAGEEEVNKSTLVFMGHLIEQQGVQHVIRAVPSIIDEIPNFKFMIIGGGPYIDDLKKLAEQLGIKNEVVFKGFVENHEDVERLISTSALAIALYEEGNYETNFTYYTDPGKIKAYLGSGLPIILSDVPPIAQELEKNQCGKIISHDSQSITDAVISFLRDKEELNRYRENVKNYAAQFNWDVIFNNIYKSL